MSVFFPSGEDLMVTLWFDLLGGLNCLILQSSILSCHHSWVLNFETRILILLNKFHSLICSLFDHLFSVTKSCKWEQPNLVMTLEEHYEFIEFYRYLSLTSINLISLKKRICLKEQREYFISIFPAKTSYMVQMRLLIQVWHQDKTFLYALSHVRRATEKKISKPRVLHH